ncbi:MAG: aldo/keto reductase [Desulfarculaceae bacterium]|jgi:predicted aldo/keto reductase-like oxidoreductase
MCAEKNLNRRNFFKAAGAAGLGAALGGGLPSGPLAAAAENAMPSRPFGKTGVEVPILSLGTMWDTINNQIVLRQAMALGITYWDTAASYQGGYSEVGIGKYFKRFPDSRKKVFLVTKGYSRDPGELSGFLETSLKKLNTNYVDLYFIHSISGIDEMTDKVRAWAEKAKSQGKIRLFGFSTHRNMESCLLGAAKLKWIDGIMMTYNYRIMHNRQMRDAVAACTQAGIGLTAMKTQGGGPVRSDSDSELRLAGRFLKKGYTPEQAKLKAIWEAPQVAAICSQMPNVTILRANAAAAMDRTRLSRADQQELRRHALATQDCYCAGCAELCESALGRQAPVAEVMRFLMYDQSHGEPLLARSLFRELPAAERARLLRLDYKAAEAACPQRLPIAKLMHQAVRSLS